MTVFGFPFASPFGANSASPNPGVGAATATALVSTLQPRRQDFGQDILVFPDLDASMTPTNDARVLGEAIGRRYITQRGTLPFHDDYGMDLRGYLNSEVTPDLLFQMQAEMEAEALKDERVFGANVAATFDPGTQAFTADVGLDTALGPYTMTVRVTQLTVELLQGAQA